MALPSFQIGKIKVAKAIVQQGMAIEISLSDIAAAVANKGGIGTIAGSALTPTKLRAEIRRARELIDPSAGGRLFVNIMRALKNKDFWALVDVCIEEGADGLFIGAGRVEKELFDYCKGVIELVPIVSRSVSLKQFAKDGVKPAAIDAEAGLDAGGHLGSKFPEAPESGWRFLLAELLETLDDLGWQDVPIIIAGGLLTAEDVAEAFELGASAVGMGYRFAMSMDARDRLAPWQDVMLKLRHTIVSGGRFGHGSPTNFPSREFVSPLVGILEFDGFVHHGQAKCRYDCLEHCLYRDGDPDNGVAPFTMSYCINRALRLALKGDRMGLYFPSGRFKEVKGLVWIADYIDYLDGDREMPEQLAA